jgi:hypothetical protein
LKLLFFDDGEPAVPLQLTGNYALCQEAAVNDR